MASPTTFYSKTQISLKMKVEDLRAVLNKRGLDITGTRSELQQRLRQAIHPDSQKNVSMKDVANHVTFLEKQKSCINEDAEIGKSKKRKINVVDDTITVSEIQPNSKKVEFDNTIQSALEIDDTLSDWSKNKLLEDCITENEKNLKDTINVICKSTKAVMYLNKYESGGNGKCIMLNGEWLTPNLYEKKAGSKAKNYKISIKYDGKPFKELLTNGKINRNRIQKTKDVDHNNDDENSQEETSDEEEDKEGEEYSVEKILRSKTIKKTGQVQYLVKWVGYDQPTWDLGTHIPKEIIEDFINSKNENTVSIKDKVLHENKSDKVTDLDGTNKIKNETDVDDDSNEIKSVNDKVSANNQDNPEDNQIRICILCIPNKHIIYSQDMEEQWFQHLVKIHFKTKFSSFFNKIINIETVPEYCTELDCMESINKSRKKMRDHFISMHGMEKVEKFYEKAIQNAVIDVEPKTEQSIDTKIEDNDIEMVAVVGKGTVQQKKNGLKIKSIDDLNINEAETEAEEIKKCVLRRPNGQLCKKVVSGKSEESKKAWYKHLYLVHLKLEFDSKVALYEERVGENETVKCKACDFTDADDTITMGKHIIKEHGDKIFDNLYDKKCQRKEEIEDTEGSEDLLIHQKEMETENENSSSNQLEKDTSINSTIPDSENQQTQLVIPKFENNHSLDVLPSENTCPTPRLFPFKSNSLDDDNDDDIEILDTNTEEEVEKPTTKIRVWIDLHDAYRNFNIDKPFLHITLRDVKKYLHQQRYFHKILEKRHEFHVKYKLDDGNDAIEKIDRDNFKLPNINGEIHLECWMAN